MRALLLLPFCLMGLAACSDQRASYEVTESQSLTAISFRNLAWGPYQLEIVVRNEPKCQRRYPLHKIENRDTPVEVYAYEGSRYALLTGQAKYVFDFTDCEITQFKDIPDLRPQDRLGAFQPDSSGTLMFSPQAR